MSTDIATVDRSIFDFSNVIILIIQYHSKVKVRMLKKWPYPLVSGASTMIQGKRLYCVHASLCGVQQRITLQSGPCQYLLAFAVLLSRHAKVDMYEYSPKGFSLSLARSPFLSPSHSLSLSLSFPPILSLPLYPLPPSISYLGGTTSRWKLGQAFSTRRGPNISRAIDLFHWLASKEEEEGQIKVRRRITSTWRWLVYPSVSETLLALMLD